VGPVADFAFGARGAALAFVAAGGLLTATADAAVAQSWRTMTVSRQAADVGSLEVRVRYAVGEVRLRSIGDGLLYRMELRYDEDAMDPVAAFDGRRLELGVDSRGRSLNVGRNRKAGSMRVDLGRGVPMTLGLELGAVEADLDLGGLSLVGLDLATGASASRLDVSTPNPSHMPSAKLQVGAADFTARRVGNLNADRLEVSAGVGQIELDFSGHWQRDLDVLVEMGVGSLELRFPEGIGVRLVKQSFLTALDSQGLIKRGDAYLSPDWDEAAHRITVDIKAAFGSIDVVWIK
jgi:hypothetical protein